MRSLLQKMRLTLLIAIFSISSGCTHQKQAEISEQVEPVSGTSHKCPDISGTYHAHASEFFHKIVAKREGESIVKDACVVIQRPSGDYSGHKDSMCSLDKVFTRHLSDSELERVFGSRLSDWYTPNWIIVIQQPEHDIINCTVFDGEKLFLYSYTLQAQWGNFTCNGDEIILFSDNDIVANSKHRLFPTTDGSLTYIDSDTLFVGFMPIPPFFVPLYHYEEKRYKWERVK